MIVFQLDRMSMTMLRRSGIMALASSMVTRFAFMDVFFLGCAQAAFGGVRKG